jgi:NAD(P)-dependent dehydrogenase (short-subunit alcohol dehydrogenase family)
MAKERRPLSGKVVAITGGARGIGKATAAALVRRGCRVAIGDLDLPLAEQTAVDLGRGTIAIPLDVTDRDSFAAFLGEVERQLGPLDVLINNAGIMPVTPFTAEGVDSIRRQLEINVYGVLVGMQLAIERMQPRRTGHIVNLSSSAGKAGVPGIATYCGTKHAVVGSSEAVRAELRDSGIEISCVMPLPVNTALAHGLAYQRGVKLVEPEEVADEIVDALEVPRFDVYVPRSLKVSVTIGALLPRRAREAFGRFMGIDKVMTEADHGARRGYEERAAKSHSAGAEAGESEAEPAAQRDAA